MRNRASLWKPFGSERVNETQKLLKSAENYFYPTFSLFWTKSSWKKLFSTRSEILGLLDNTLTGNYEYSRTNRENLPWPIQIKLSKKLGGFCCIVFKFLLLTWNFQCSETKNEPQRLSISEFVESERCAYLNPWEGFFLKTPWNWTCKRITKTPEVCRKVLLSYLFFILGQIDLEKVIFNQIWDFWSAW